MWKRLIACSLIAVLAVPVFVHPMTATAQEGGISTPPPPPRIEHPGRPPGPNAVWISGYWTWRDAQYQWVTGRWETPLPGRVYVPGRWRKTNAGWQWQPGGWRR